MDDNVVAIKKAHAQSPKSALQSFECQKYTSNSHILTTPYFYCIRTLKTFQIFEYLKMNHAEDAVAVWMALLMFGLFT